MKLQVEQCMHLKRQKVGFGISRDELYCNVFLHFINPITIMHNGKKLRVSANCCYIGTKGSPIFYKAEHISMLHNFVHFFVDDVDDLSRMGLPLDTPFYTDLQDDITNTIERMEWSMSVNSNPSNKQYAPPIESAFEDLLHKLAVEKKTTNMSAGYSQEHTFDNLRTQIYVSPGDWNVDKMADFVHLSRSHFSIKYREIFGVTPNADINTASLLVACRLLTTTNISVNKISRSVGYARSDYFIKLFRSKYGLTPIEYRKFHSFKSEEN